MHEIINASYCVRYTDFDFLLDVAHATATGVELAINYEDEAFMQLQNARRADFLRVPVTFHGPFTNVEATSAPGSLDNERYLDAYRQAFDVYEAFAARSIVLHTHKMHYIPQDEKERLRAYTLETMTKVAQMAAARNIRMTVENVGTWIWDSVLFDQEQFIAFFDQLPQNVGALLDVGHALINHWDVSHVIHALNTRIHSYHLHNNNACKDSHRPLFEAGNRYSAQEMVDLLTLTNKYSPDADWILEYAPGEHITKELVAQDLEALKALNC